VSVAEAVAERVECLGALSAYTPMTLLASSRMRRRFTICLFVLGIYAAWLPIVRATTDKMSREATRSSSGSPEGQLSPADYLRTDFSVENGLPNNVVNAIVQTENGLLWVGTDSGLASFDGREFSPIDLETAGARPQGGIHALLESTKGDLWVGTDAGVVRISKTALDQVSSTLLTFYRLGAEPNNEVQDLFQDRNGVLWAGSNHGLYREDSGKFVSVIPDLSISRIAENQAGHLLLINDGKFIDWDGQNAYAHPDLAKSLGAPGGDIFHVFQDHAGTMWYSTIHGIFRSGSKPMPPLRPVGTATTSVLRTYEDTRDNIWIVTGTGVYQVTGDVIEDTPVPNTLPQCFLADREGGFWVGTNGNGLIHLKRRTVHMFTIADGLLSNIAMTVIASHDGRIWTGSNCGLSVYDGKRFRSYREKDGLLNSCVWSLAEDQKQNLWIGTYGGGLFRFRDERFVQYSLEQGLPSNVVLQVLVARDGSLWMATLNGVSHMQNGRFRNYTVADGLSSNQVVTIFQDRSGRIWACTQAGLDRLTGERFVPFPSAGLNDRPFVVRLAEDSSGNLYAASSPKGINLVKDNQLVPLSEDLKLLDMVEAPQRVLWGSGTNGILRVRLDDLKNSLEDRDSPLAYEVIDRSDGLNSIQCSIGSPNIAISPDNKLWVATVRGLAMIDLAHLPSAGRKPKVFIGEVTVGRDRLLAGGKAVLPAGTNHVELHLKAVDLESPEKIRLQYRLDGVDGGWLNATASRTAVYTNVPHGSHTFHVRATGSDGVWDQDGIVYSITQQPYFYQRTWFLVVCLAALALLAWQVSQWRVQQAQSRARLQMEERLSERARIARELHDTLLQSFQGLILKFQRARNLLPARPQQAMESLDTALDKAERAIMESRDAINDIRSFTPVNREFAEELSALSEELAATDGRSSLPSLRVVIEGSSKTLRPLVRNELLQIAREALRNAHAHANAQNIEAEIRYEEGMLRVRIRDDGVGINQEYLGETGRAGHYGLRGMRERAAQMGAQLDVWSEQGAGTEIELRVPDRVAYKAG
jgi:signal transduction histidine kinase/ligand-binding sensor domain-containing protein